MTQYARPISPDIAVGNWSPYPSSPTTLYDKLDEATIDDDSTYAYGTLNAGTFVVKLDEIDTPSDPSSCTLYVMFRTSGSGGPEKIDIYLKEDYEGTPTTHGTWANVSNRSETYANGAGAVDLSSVSDWSNLYVQIDEDTIGSGEEVRVTQIYLETPDGTVHYTLVCSAGSYSLSGQTLNTLYGRAILASPDSYSLSGGAALLEHDKKVVLSPDSYSLSGQALSLLYGRKIQLTAGSYSLIGSDLTLEYSGVSWLTGWGFRKKIDIQDTYVDSNLSDFPVYVKIDADADFHEARSDGYDIRFTEDDGETLLKYRRLYWTGGNGSAATAHFWVKVPSILSSGGATIYCYYGKSDASDGEDAANTYNSAYKAAWDCDDSSGTITDSLGNHDSSSESINAYQQTGKIKYAIDLVRASNNHFQVADHADWDTTAYTLEFLINTDDRSSGGSLAFQCSGDDGILADISSSKIRFNTKVDGTFTGATNEDSAGSDGVWYLYHLRRDSSGVQTMVKNGAVQTDSDTRAGALTPTGTFYIMAESGGANTVDCQLCHVRWSNAKRTDAWCKFQCIGNKITDYT